MYATDVDSVVWVAVEVGDCGCGWEEPVAVVPKCGSRVVVAAAVVTFARMAVTVVPVAEVEIAVVAVSVVESHSLIPPLQWWSDRTAEN